jgi:hypothetical protein
VTLAAPPRLAVFGSSLPVTVRCSESCAVTADLVVGVRDARRLRIRRRIVAAGEAQLDARGTTYAFLRFERRTLRALRRHAATRATLRVAATDRAGNNRTLRRGVTIRR